MTRRTERILRKYVLALRLAQLATAKAERHRRALEHTRRRLVDAQAQLGQHNRQMEGADLAARLEWSDRLAAATASLDMPLNDASAACVDAARAATLANGQAEIVERTHHAALQSDTRDREIGQLQNLPRKLKSRGMR